MDSFKVAAAMIDFSSFSNVDRFKNETATVTECGVKTNE